MLRSMFSGLFLIGVVSAIVVRLTVMHQTSSPSSWSKSDASQALLGTSGRDVVEESGRERSTDTTDANLVLVGVMTAKQFLATRAVAAYDTWVSSIPGKARSSLLYGLIYANYCYREPASL